MTHKSHTASVKSAAMPEVPPSAPSAASPARVPIGKTEPQPPPEPEFGYTSPDEYDLADYRWVPVRRQPRYDGWTEEKQRRFIEVLADTGMISHAAKEVGMSRTSAYRLRRAPHAAAFARAWDLARERAGALIEDIAFERAIEGVEQEVYDGHGELVSSRTVYNDRLLTFLLGQLKPERYGRDAHLARLATHGEQGAEAGKACGQSGQQALEHQGDAAAPGSPPRELTPPDAGSPCPVTLDEALRAMEPALPAAAKESLDLDALVTDLQTADIADGKLPNFLSEQRTPKSPERVQAEERCARYERGRLANEKLGRKEPLDEAEFADLCYFYDPTVEQEERKKRQGA